MKVCIIGEGLVSLTLANVLVKKHLFVEIVKTKKNKQYDHSRTLGVTKSNVDYFNNRITSITKILWEIKKIKIYTEKNLNKELIKFDNSNKQIFSIVRNYELQKLLIDKLKRSKYFKFRKKKDFIKEDYKLVINCDPAHLYTKKFFSKKIEKNYRSNAYTTTIIHKKIKNNTAFQNFTRNGPIAFLPISNVETSIVYSLRSSYKKSNDEMNNLVKKFNPIYFIKKINNWSSFELKSSNLRNYYKGNILAFGDLLHKIHPHAGQGFNMSMRDIKLLSDLIDEKLNLGLDLDTTICQTFQQKSKDKNYIFSSSIDLIYEFFNLESKVNSNLILKSINIFGNNKFFNKILRKFADNGIRV